MKVVRRLEYDNLIRYEPASIQIYCQLIHFNELISSSNLSTAARWRQLEQGAEEVVFLENFTDDVFAVAEAVLVV